MKEGNGTSITEIIAIGITLLGITVALLMCWMTPAHGAECAACGKVKERLQSTLKGTAIGEVREAPGMSGIYEVQMGRTIAYTNADGSLFILGHLYDPARNLDLTAERLQELNRVDWKSLPLQDAIVSGPEDGPKLAIFTDPDCPYCQQLERMLSGMKVRVYTFLFPLEAIHPDARAKAEAIWCMKDRHAALQDAMLNGKTITAGKCDNPVARNIELGQQLGVNGTPTMINGAGLILAGIPKSKDDFMTWLGQK